MFQRHVRKQWRYEPTGGRFLHIALLQMMNKGTVFSKLVGIIDIFRPDANNAKTRKRKKKIIIRKHLKKTVPVINNQQAPSPSLLSWWGHSLFKTLRHRPCALVCVSCCLVGFPGGWHDIYTICFTRFPHHTCTQTVSCNQSCDSLRPPGSTSSPSPRWTNSEVKLDGQPVYRARQVLTDLILAGRGRTSGRDQNRWGGVDV